MRLALEFNEPDVDLFLAGLDARQFLEWMDYFALGDTDAERDASASHREFKRDKTPEMMWNMLKQYTGVSSDGVR